MDWHALVPFMLIVASVWAAETPKITLTGPNVCTSYEKYRHL